MLKAWTVSPLIAEVAREVGCRAIDLWDACLVLVRNTQLIYSIV